MHHWHYPLGDSSCRALGWPLPQDQKELLWDTASNSKGNCNSCIPSNLTSDFHQLEEHFKVGAVMKCRMFYL